MTTIRLDAAEAAELAEILESIIDWISQLTVPELRGLLLVEPTYCLADLYADLDRHKTHLLTAKIVP